MTQRITCGRDGKFAFFVVTEGPDGQLVASGFQGFRDSVDRQVIEEWRSKCTGLELDKWSAVDNESLPICQGFLSHTLTRFRLTPDIYDAIIEVQDLIEALRRDPFGPICVAWLTEYLPHPETIKDVLESYFFPHFWQVTISNLETHLPDWTANRFGNESVARAIPTDNYASI